MLLVSCLATDLIKNGSLEKSGLTLAPLFSLGYSCHIGVFAIHAYIDRYMGILFFSVTPSALSLNGIQHESMTLELIMTI